MPSTERFDAIVVGGGPAGSTCARRLTGAGMRVAVVDKATFPRDKVCAGWITPAVAETLALDLDAYARERVLQPVRAFRAGMMGQAGVRVAFDAVMSYGIRRCEFDDYLLVRSGAALRLGEGVRWLAREGGEWRVNDCLRAPLLVGAGGHACPVARRLGARPGRGEAAVTAQEVEFRLDGAETGTAAGEPEFYFCDDLKGYGWCFRKGDYLNVGLGRQRERRISDRVDEFVAWLQEEGRIPAQLPRGCRGHAYLLYERPARRLVGDGALLIGDAAGLAYPQSGEGIRPAVESACLAAETILAVGGDYAESRLAGYADRLGARFGGRRAPQPAAGPLTRAAAAALMRLPWFVRRYVVERWFLHLQQPPLAPAPESHP